MWLPILRSKLHVIDIVVARNAALHSMRVLCQWFLVFTCHYEVGCSILGKLFFPDPPLPTWRWNSIGSLLDQASTSECILFLLGQKRKFEKRGLVCFSSERWFHFNYFLISCTCTVNVSLLVQELSSCSLSAGSHNVWPAFDNELDLVRGWLKNMTDSDR